LSEAELFKSKERSRKQLARSRKIKTSQNSGESVTRNFSWQSSKKRKKKDRELGS